MAALTLDIISPIVRSKMLERNILDGVSYAGYGDRILSEYQAQNIFYTPLELDYKKPGEYHIPMLALGDIQNVKQSTDGYYGNVRRPYYPKQWDKRGYTEDAADYIYRNIEEPDNRLVKLWGDSERNQYSSYLDYTNAIFGRNEGSSLWNIIGGVVSGEGVSLSLGSGGVSVVSNLDIQQTLAGRIFGSFSGKETPLGKFGLKAAAVAMAQGAINKTSKVVSGAVSESVNWLVDKMTGQEADFDMSEFLGNSKSITNEPGILDDILSSTGLSTVINTVAGGLGLGGILNDITDVTKTASVDRPNYIEIDVEDVLINGKAIRDNKVATYVDVGGRFEYTLMQGFDLYLSGYNKIYPAYQELQQNELLSWTGNVNARELFKNIRRNNYSPLRTKNFGKKPDVIKQNDYWVKYKEGYDRQSGLNTGLIVKRVIYTWGNSQGGIPGSKINWKPNNGEADNSYQIIDDKLYSLPNDYDTLMWRTEALFRMGIIKTMVSSFGKKDENLSPIQSAIDALFGMSRGKNLLKKYPYGVYTKSGYEDPYCRVWTWEKQYRRVRDAIRPLPDGQDENGNPILLTLKKLHEKIKEEAHIRTEVDWFARRTSLQDNGRVKIAPHRSDFDGKDPDGRGRKQWEGKKEDRFLYNNNYFLSIENLAWKDIILEDVLCPSQIGPNGGRIMWFSPLNLDFDEQVSVDLHNETFIGRGEEVFTYTNTTRSGTLKFTMVVDHSSFTEYMKSRKTFVDNGGNNSEEYQTILRFDAGCEVPELYSPYRTEREQKKETSFELKPPERNIPPENVNPREETNILVRVYFPNDYTGRDEPYTVDEEHKGVFDYSRGRATMYYLFSWGYEMMEGKSSSVVNVSTREMDENATNISCKNTNKKTFKLKNGTDVDAIATFASLMYKTDMMHNPNFKDAYNYIIDIKDAEAQSQKKTTKIPGREMLLPRWGYPRLVYHWDLTAFSLNDIKKADKGGDALYSWYDFYIFSDPYFSYIDEQKIIVDIFKNAKKIRILGNASARDVGDNMKLALNRAQTLAFYIEEALGINVFGDEDKYTVGVGDSNFGVDEACSSTENSKKGRFAYIEIVTDVTETKPLNEAEIIAAEQQFKTESDNYIKAKNEFKPTTLTAKYIGRYDEEMEFYNYLDTNVDLTYSNIKDKYNHHIPCFWSLTPEGLNARLTFLHQCTRQGPTIGASDMSVDTNNPTNLSFGRPPVCILRIGDFIQSRIYIESLSLDYKNGNGLSWDLNPEGIGPQPMTANVSINFKFMGGQDLSGAISRLQNAVTFNYYANTGVYDDRSDSNYYFINPADGKEKLTGRPNTGFDSTEYLFNPTISIKSGANAEKVIGSYKNGLDYNGYIRNTETQDFVDKAEEIKKNSIMPELTSTSKPQLSDVIIRPPGQQEQQVPTIQTNEVTVKSRDPEGSIREFEYDPKSDAPLLMKGWF